ncbi:Cytochrome P450 family protein [Rhynchospora pubera]|uniref:Cytochrome P450 family protein n=1 Tax=Rhynchospora pubera TaxID=906938 RepID=A0AAV8DIY1_9POAL|nr:Cytochrome P450 family protein [Rhynchospora pubera]
MELLHLVLSVTIGALVLDLLVFHVLSKWNEIRYRVTCKSPLPGLPPGTMGWPLIGESISFLKRGPDFVTAHRTRYGNIFKTHLFGKPTVVCTDSEVNKYILISESKGNFLLGYPRTFFEMIGKWSTLSLYNSEHKAMRGALISLVNGPALRDRVLPKIDEFMQSYLHNWTDKILDFQKKSNESILLLILKLVASKEENIPSTKELEDALHQVFLTFFAPAINLPGTTYNKGLKARRKLVQMLGNIIEERRASICSRHNDILDTLLENSEYSKNSVIQFTDEQIIDQIFGIVLSGYSTTSYVLMMAVKYLHDHPHVQDELRKENLEIRKGRPENYTINWDDYKCMSFTRAVVMETLRMTSVPGFFRRTTEDFEIKGYIIPKGWRIFICTIETNKDLDIYPEPLKFNPWRWLKSNLESHQHFMLFGGGARLCPGKELGILEISIFLHHLVTRYRWEEVGENKIVTFPKVEAPNGLYFRFHDL